MAFFGNIEFTYGNTWTYKYSASLILYNKGNLVYNKTINYGSLPYTLSFYKGVPAGSKTMRLLDLPTTPPKTKGSVWNDKGTLKIVT